MLDGDQFLCVMIHVDIFLCENYRFVADYFIYFHYSDVTINCDIFPSFPSVLSNENVRDYVIEGVKIQCTK